MTTLNKEHGQIVYWNKIFGFIEYGEEKNSIFFHRSVVENGYQVSLLDKVTFLITKVSAGKHKGKAQAKNVELLEKGDLAERPRWIGKLENWNRRYGTIECLNLERKTTVYQTRLVKDVSRLHEKEYVIFSPIKCKKRTNRYFAFYAYPLSKEIDLAFLREKRKGAYQKIIDDQLLHIIESLEEKNSDLIFEEKILRLLQRKNGNTYDSIIKLIENHRKTFDVFPSYTLLNFYLDNATIIQLWEDEKIDEIDGDLLERYFFDAKADVKRAIINRIKDDSQLKFQILNGYLMKLWESGKMDKATRELKTFLDIIYRNKKTREPQIYKPLLMTILSEFDSKDIFELMRNGYIHVPKKYLKANFSAKELLSFWPRKPNEKVFYREIIEEYLLSFASNEKFYENYPELVEYLKKYNQLYPGTFAEIAKACISGLEVKERIILWLFIPELPFDGAVKLQAHWKELELGYLLRYLSQDNVDEKDVLAKEMASCINEDELRSFARSFSWNELILPVAPKDQGPSVISDLKVLIEKFNLTKLPISQCAIILYNHIPDSTVHHIRFWLFGYVHSDRYDYFSYRKGFKELEKTEKKLFRSIAEIIYDQELEQFFSEVVVNCQPPQLNDNEIKQYTAFVENIYFSKGEFKLRMEDGEFTEPFLEPQSSIGLNTIPKGHSLNQLEFEILVQENKIIEVKGLDVLFNQIHRGQIEEVLSRSERNGPAKEGTPSYIEDWQLQNTIISYLKKIQVPGLKTLLVNEPRSFYRRMTEDSDIDAYETCELFTVEAPDGYAIVWQNIDFSRDKAAFVFKTFREDYNDRIMRIKEAIGKYAQLRSALISKQDNEPLQTLRECLGFVSSIRRSRGRTNAFQIWKNKFDEALEMPIPELPDPDECANIPSEILVRNTPPVGPISITEDDDVPKGELPEDIHTEDELAEEEQIKIFTLLQDINNLINKTNYENQQFS